MIPHERFEEAASAVQFNVPPKVQAAGVLIVDAWRRQKACLQWVSGQAIGLRGGWSGWEIQQITGAAARGDNWQMVRDGLLEKRAMQRRQLPRVSQSPSGSTR